MTVHYDHAGLDDVPALAALFQNAFPEALTAVFNSSHINPRPVEEVFQELYRFEPEGIFVARDTRVVGFMIAVTSLEGLYRHLILGGGLAKILGRWLTGRYDLGVGFVPRLLKAWWDYRSVESPVTRRPQTAQILSIVVDPSVQHQGIGSALTERCLAYLRTTPAAWARLEVDAAKPGPIALYKKFGFKEVGQMPSPRGPALIMTLALK